MPASPGSVRRTAQTDWRKRSVAGSINSRLSISPVRLGRNVIALDYELTHLQLQRRQFQYTLLLGFRCAGARLHAAIGLRNFNWFDFDGGGAIFFQPELIGSLR